MSAKACPNKHYRYLATSIDGFIQQLAVSHVSRGYWFYVLGRIPEEKDATSIDAKLIEAYEIDRNKWQRSRRKAAGLANIHYLRHENTFVLLASHGNHTFFEREANAIRDCRKAPIRAFGYSVSYRNKRASVRIDEKQLKLIRSYLLDRALSWDHLRLERELRKLPFAAYAPVRQQLVKLWRDLCRKRAQAGLEPLSKFCLRLQRKQVRVFE